jgi:hypothetical protein
MMTGRIEGRGSWLSEAILLQTAYTWDGEPAGDLEKAMISCQIDAGLLHIQVKAPFHGDEAPGGVPGPTDHLWEYEVVELFLAGADNHYLEIEFGPHGHYLTLLFSGIRQKMRSDISMRYDAEISGDRWWGSAQLDLAGLPAFRTVNAYAIHGTGQSRRYLAAFPVPGKKPDFHQPHLFKAIEDLHCR